MREDPVAKRNRGNNHGIWLLGTMAAVVVALLIVYMFRPQTAVTASLPDPVPVTMAQRIQADEARMARQDAARPYRAAVPEPLAIPATE